MKRTAFLVILLAAGCGDGSPTAPQNQTPAFQGTWTGVWLEQNCTETGGAVGVGCAALPDTGGLRITLTQTGAAVQGTVEIGTIAVPVSGEVTGGALALTGQTRFQDSTVSISQWSTAIGANNTMTGAFSVTIAPDQVGAGTVTVRAALDSVIRTG